MKTKTVQVTLKLCSGRDNFDVCEMVEKVLVNSSMNNAELKLDVIETKVIKETDDKENEEIV